MVQLISQNTYVAQSGAPAAPPAAEPAPPAAGDTVTVSPAPEPAPAPAPAPAPGPGAPQPKGLLDRLVALPRVVVEGIAGSIGAVVGIAFKTLPGAIEGLAHGISFEKKDPADPYQGYYYPSTGWYTVTTVAETMAAGAGIGAVAGGPLGLALGTGAGFVVGVVGRVLEGRAKIPKEFVRQVDEKVDLHCSDNEGQPTKVRFQNAVEGAIAGARSGVRQGAVLGWDAGKGCVSGVMDVAEGALEGLKEAIFGK